MINIKVNEGIHFTILTIHPWLRPLGTTGGGGEARDMLAKVGQREIDRRTCSLFINLGLLKHGLFSTIHLRFTRHRKYVSLLTPFKWRYTLKRYSLSTVLEIA